MVLVIVFPGWSGKNPQQRFALLRKRLEAIPGVSVVIIDYVDVRGPLTKLRTRSSIEELTSNAERRLPYTAEERVIAIGHSLGCIIIRSLIKRGHKFDLCIFAGGPHKGFSPKFLRLGHLASLLGVKPFFELTPGSEFLKSLGESPPGIYIGSQIDKKVPIESAIPKIAGRLVFYLYHCGHNMFPHKEKNESASAIPIVVEVVRKYVKDNSL
ncbi:MAG: hypothetical protein BWX72_00334 [Firmicutes bacterium ADurb.Bin080]|jgi:hypothetical protein|nr:MAG: hypothetical protein BWX72_00334 [Firmicutes bacterium ADurb.Bin080]